MVFWVRVKWVVGHMGWVKLDFGFYITNEVLTSVKRFSKIRSAVQEETSRGGNFDPFI